MVSVFIRHLLVQLETPDAIRGRVSAVSSMFIGASNELGEFESGVDGALARARALGGARRRRDALVVVATYLKLFPELRRMDRFPLRELAMRAAQLRAPLALMHTVVALATTGFTLARPRVEFSMARSSSAIRPSRAAARSRIPPAASKIATREEVDDGWYREEIADSIARDRAARSRAQRHHHQRLAGCRLRLFDQSLPGLRAWMHLLLRPPEPRLSWVSRPVSISRPSSSTRRTPRRCSRSSWPSPSYVCKPITLGINTDGYQPVEQRLEVTRSILDVLARTRHPVSIITKSALVVRDLDLLADMAKDNLVSRRSQRHHARPPRSSARSSRARPRRRRGCAS